MSRVGRGGQNRGGGKKPQVSSSPALRCLGDGGLAGVEGPCARQLSKAIFGRGTCRQEWRHGTQECVRHVRVVRLGGADCGLNEGSGRAGINSGGVDGPAPLPASPILPCRSRFSPYQGVCTRGFLSPRIFLRGAESTESRGALWALHYAATLLRPRGRDGRSRGERGLPSAPRSRCVGCVVR